MTAGVNRQTMQGLELSKTFYEEYGRPMLEKDFPDLLPYLAAGLFGSGSECFGFDDEISQDHDFEPAFCLLLPDEDVVDRRSAFLLERAYAKLPKEYRGYKRSVMLPVGGARHGVLRTAEVFMDKTGTPDGELSVHQWLSLPEPYLAEATNGEIFYDGLGEVTQIRKRLAYYPEEIRLKKLAGYLLLMAQSGQYNYPRCVGRNETAAAQMAAFEFVKSGLAVTFLLNRKYQPYYKWSFRALRDLPILSEMADDFEFLITTGNEKEAAEEKSLRIEKISAEVISVLEDQQLTRATCNDLEKHAYSVNDGISDSETRNLHILAGI